MKHIKRSLKLNSVKFKLLIPETRNGMNEILGTLIAKDLGFIAPETFNVPVKFNWDVDPEMKIRSPDAANLLLPSLNCTAPDGGAEPVTRFPFTNAQPKSAI
mgnify:CR=1 FL=1